ncbi:MAG: ornithine carbamoyltransferase [Planctomycetia bacterium]|nr:ornithine carbamoyltransferase [Planctomycetia bacterium]
MKKVRHFINLSDVKNPELDRIFQIAEELKSEWKSGVRKQYLQGKVIALIFEKMSLRTRVSFESGMVQLGGGSVFLENQHIGLGVRESVADIGHVLSSMVDGIVYRAKKHTSVTSLAKYCSCPVINALTDQSHPCQALADMLTIKEEFGKLEGIKIAWVGDSNNVAASLVEIAAKLGVQVVVSSPEGYEFSEKQIKKLCGSKPKSAFSFEKIQDPFKAVAGADAIYTDVWVSMGQENEEEERKKAFARWQINKELMKRTGKKSSIFLHCLPARRGLEVTDEIMDSPQSRIVEQAANRMHAQKGLLVWLLNEAGKKENFRSLSR